MKSAVAQAAITPVTHMLAAAALSLVIVIALWQRQGHDRSAPSPPSWPRC